MVPRMLVSCFLVVCLVGHGCSPRETTTANSAAKDSPTPTIPEQEAGKVQAMESSAGPGETADSDGPVEEAGKEEASVVAGNANAEPGNAANGPAESQASPDGARGPEKKHPNAECENLLAQLKSLRERIPFVFVDLKRKPSEINADILQSIRLAESFLSKCADSDALPSVKAHLARDLLKRYNVVKKELPPGLSESERNDAATKYLNRVESLAKEASEKSAPESDAYLMAVGTLADSAAHALDFARQRTHAMNVLERRPDYEYRSKFIVDVARCYMHEGRYEEEVKFLRKWIPKCWDDPELVLYHNALIEALQGNGDLEGIEDLCMQMRGEYPSRMKTVESGFLRGGFEQWLYTNGFWIGFARYALGDVDGARKVWEECKALIDRYEEDLKEQGKELPNVIKIIRQFRIRDHLVFQEQFQGKEPSVDLDPGIDWITEEKPTLKGLRGKVVALVFRPPRNKRAATFLQEVDRLVNKHNDLAGITLGYYPNRVTPEGRQQRKQAMREDLEELGVSLPAGFDATPRQSIFRALHATVGSPSFLMFDRKGRLAWYRLDPTDLDRAVVRRVVERMIADK